MVMKSFSLLQNVDFSPQYGNDIELVSQQCLHLCNMFNLCSSYLIPLKQIEYRL